MDAKLGILGVGSYLPPKRAVRELVAQAGADTQEYKGWDHICVAENEDHPSTMAARALQKALRQADVSPADLKLVLSGGVSRDYPPSWSVATEAMRLIEAPSTCLGLDTTIGCMGTLTGLEIAQGWLRSNGGGYVAIVNAERWVHTVEFDTADEDAQRLWGHSDGASAAVVGLDVGRPAIATYEGTCFSSHADSNGFVLIKYGGTRFPVAPEGQNPFVRKLGGEGKKEIFQIYLGGYLQAFSALKERFDISVDRVACNQISPMFVQAIAGVAGVDIDRVIRTGPDSGHTGSADLLLGVEQLMKQGDLRGTILLAASTPYAFGTGLITA
jgi:3-oxoacyl-[acyl-carrier-protein] synthase III